MKKLYLIGTGLLIAGGALALTSCDNGETANDLGLTYTVTNNGLDVDLSWDEIEGADYYVISVDGTDIDTTTDNTVTTYTVTSDNAGAVITVTAVGADLSAQVDFTAKANSNVEVWEASGAGNSAVGFDQDGNASTYSITDNSNYSLFDFYLNDWEPGTVDPASITIVSPDIMPDGSTPGYNDEENYSTAWGSGVVAPNTGYLQYYPNSGGIVSSASYALWIDPSGNGWDTNDHFVKIDVTSIGSDGKVTMNLYYQVEGGLLWVP